MKKLYISILAVVILISLISYFKYNSYAKEINAVINGNRIKIEIANNPIEYYNGLSNRESICNSCGMLFIFPDKKIRNFVMRNMKFPLDIIWISDDKIVGFDENLAPEGSKPKNLYNSEEPVDLVLEVNAGFVEKNKISINDIVYIE